MIPVLGIGDYTWATDCPFTAVAIMERYERIKQAVRAHIKQLESQGKYKRAARLVSALQVDQLHARYCSRERCSRFLKCFRGYVQLQKEMEDE